MPPIHSIASIASLERLAVVGVAKNCGKTTTLNRLLNRRRREEKTLPALVSAGIDGESEDVLLGTEKPPIIVEKDQWVATAEKALRASTAHFEYVENLGVSTPLGEVFVCRALDGGEVALGGLRHRRELIGAIEQLAKWGPGPVWIDGAYGRVMSAHPEVSPAVVVATGAICGDDVRDVVRATAELVSRLEIPIVDGNDTMGQKAIERAVDDGRVVVVSDGEEVVLQTASAVVGLEELAEKWSSTVDAVAIPGLVSDRVAEELLALGGGRRLYVPDGTVIHAEATLWETLRGQWDVRAARSVDVVAISYNPTSVTGSSVDPRRLNAALSEQFCEVPVFDAMGSESVL